MRTAGVPQPVRRDRDIVASRLRCTFQHSVDSALGKAAATFLACEHWIVGAASPRSDNNERLTVSGKSTWRNLPPLPVIESSTRSSRGKTSAQVMATTSETHSHAFDAISRLSAWTVPVPRPVILATLRMP
jgi:hypothetical protein